jgi:hypothetical protein
MLYEMVNHGEEKLASRSWCLIMNLYQAAKCAGRRCGDGESYGAYDEDAVRAENCANRHSWAFDEVVVIADDCTNRGCNNGGLQHSDEKVK